MAHFARGSRGHLITPLRRELHVELQDDSVFDAYDEFLEEMVKRFQHDHGLAVDGMVDEALYRQITGRDFPDLFDRAAMVVSRIENHGFFRTPTQADGVTAGYIGFTGASASLLKVLANIDRAEVVTAFDRRGIEPMERANYDAFLTMHDMSVKTRVAAAQDLFQQGKKSFLPKWKDFLRDVLKTQTGIASQKRVAFEDYFNPAGIAAARNHITSEFGRVMVFSSFVQSGGLRVEPPLSGAGPERMRRFEAVLTNAMRIKNNSKDNYEARHIQLGKGLGFPNNILIDPRQWGFDLPDPPPPPRARVLSLPLSSASQFEAMPKLEAAAAAHNVIEERLPTPQLNDLWPPQLASEHVKQHKEALHVLIELDELPLSCLVINATNWSGTILSAHGATLALSTALGDVLWSAAGLALPFSPQMTNGLVILYMPSGIQKRGSFAHRLQKLIATVSGSPPLIVGWIGQVALPGKDDPHHADAFFTDVKVKMGGGTLSRLIGSTPEAVIQSWGTACNSVFASNANRKLLWRAAVTKVDPEPATACAALAPDGTVWRAKETPDIPNGIFMERIT